MERDTDLAEEVSGELLLEDPLLGDEVEEVLARLGTLHHDDEGVVPLKVVQEADHPWEVKIQFQNTKSLKTLKSLKALKRDTQEC